MDTLLRYGLLAVFTALVLTPFGLPIPEDVSLLVAGVLVRLGHAVLPAAFLVGWSGVMIGDSIAWTMGRKVGLHPSGFIARLVGHEDIERIERFYRRFGSWAILIARQFPGMRLPAFFFAGASGIPYRRFFAIDGSAAVLTASIYIALGYTFADNLPRILAWLDRMRVVGTAVLGLAAILVAWRILRRRLRREER